MDLKNYFYDDFMPYLFKGEAFLLVISTGEFVKIYESLWRNTKILNVTFLSAKDMFLCYTNK